MRMNRRMTRRMAIGLAIAGTAAMLPAQRLVAVAHGGAADRASLNDMIMSLFGDRRAAATVGRAYLAQRPEERNAPRLLARVLETDSGASAMPSLAAADLHAWLRQRSRADFAAGRTVWVEGWLLAQTEARLYALAALA